MAINNEVLPKFTITYPSTVRLREGRLLFGVHKASEFTVAPAITKVTRIYEMGVYSVVTLIGGPDLPTGIDLGDTTIDSKEEFNAFGYDQYLNPKNGYDRFTTAMVGRNGAGDIQLVEQLELNFCDIDALFSFVALGASSQIQRFVTFYTCATQNVEN